jgi:radical SAM enzyme (TIGR01210 family)
MGVMHSMMSEYASLIKRFSLGKNETVYRMILNLPGAGCEYWKRDGGCTMCGFHVATNKYTRGRLLSKWIFQLLYIMAQGFYLKNAPFELFVYNGGSFLNDREIPVGFQDWFFKQVSMHKTIQSVMVENRCEYITQEKIENAVQLLGGKKLYVGIGLESANDYLRNNVIRKGLSLKVFEKKVRLVRANDAFVAAYVFLKPPGLNDEAALVDVVKTIQYALAVGVSEINVSCAFIQRQTEMERMYYDGEFIPPRLDIIVELINIIIANSWPVSIGGFDDYPPPVAIPRNCDSCSENFYALIERFREERVLGDIPICSCSS